MFGKSPQDVREEVDDLGTSEVRLVTNQNRIEADKAKRLVSMLAGILLLTLRYEKFP